MESAGQSTRDLHTKVSGELNQAGYPATPQSVKPDDNSPLNNIREIIGDAARVVGGTVEENLGGTNAQTHTGVTEGKKGLLIAGIRNVLKKAA